MSTVIRRGARPALLLLLAVAVALVAGASPAAAHGRGSDATNFRSRVLEAPPIDGVTWTVFGGDEYLQVDNDGPDEVLVLDYDGRPYLRVGPDGVFENQVSTATYLNRDRFGAVAVPPEVQQADEPQWRRVSRASSYAWHDHRIHWMAPTAPPAVTDPAEPAVVFESWAVPVEVDGTAYEVRGDLQWVPGPSSVPWLLVGLVLVLPALAGLRTEPTTADGGPVPPGDMPERWPALTRPAAVVLGVVAAANVTHLVDDLFAVPIPLGTKLLAAGQTTLFIAIGVFGAVKAWQARDGAFTALGVGAGAVLVGQGLLYASTLWTSQGASVLPGVVGRGIVAVSITQALTVGAVAVIGTRRLLPPLEPEPEASTRPQASTPA